MFGSLSLGGCAEDPFDFGGPRDCTIASQNEWVYDLMQEAYLWSDQLPDVDPSSFDSPQALLGELRHSPDRWSRISDKVTSDALYQEGKVIGFGMSTRRDEAGNLIVALVHEGSPAASAGLQRGDRLLSVGQRTIAELDAADAWDDAYGPSEPGVEVEFEFEHPGTTPSRTVLRKDWLDLVTVPDFDVFTLGDRTVGYVVFTTFVQTAVEELDLAFEQFGAAGADALIVDLRYNGGGLVAVAAHLMNLVAGTQAEGAVSYRVAYGPGLADNDASRTLEPVERSLPDVRDVVFITTGSTLSASELVINGLRPHVRVRLVGDTTGGKPVGSKQWDFCEQVISPVTFRLLNAEGEGDYFDGLATDCQAHDDLLRPLGDADEDSLRHALSLLDSERCAEPRPVDEPKLVPTRDPAAQRLPDVMGVPELRGWL